MSAPKNLAPLLAGLMALCGCRGPALGGAFGERAFYPARDHYRVRALSPGEDGHRLLPDSWQLDNFQVSSSGAIGEPKSGEQWRARFALDRDNDGEADTGPVTVDLYDLRFVHADDGSVLWARTIPVDGTASRRRLDVVANDLVDRVGGTTYFRVDLSNSTGSERRVGTRVVEEGPIELNGASGWMITFDVIALDQAEADAEYVGNRVTLAFVRPTRRWMADGTSGDQGGWSMLTMFGLAGRAEIQPQHRRSFESLLSRTDFR